MKNIKNNKGFTLIELVLTIVVGGLIFGITSDLVENQLDAFSWLTNRQTALSDNRYAINRIASEFIHLETADILAITEDRIDYVDTNGQNTNFRLGSVGGEEAILRGNETLITPIADFKITYYDVNDAETTSIEAIRKFEIVITTEQVAAEGNVTLSKVITPRNFIYNSYQ